MVTDSPSRTTFAWVATTLQMVWAAMFLCGCGAAPARVEVADNLEAVAISSSAINLAWNVLPGNAADCTIERSPDGLHYAAVGTVGPKRTAFSDSGLMPATVYLYRIRGADAKGNVCYSNWNYAATLARVDPKTAPHKARAAWMPGGKILVRWQDHFDNETGWRIERSTDGKSFSLLATLGPDATSYTDETDVRPATTYHYRLVATGAAGDSKPTIPVILQAYTDTVAAPADVKAAGAHTSQIDLSWSPVAGAQGYVVLRSWDGMDFDQLDTVDAKTTHYSHKGVLHGASYHYRIAAKAAGDLISLPSERVTAEARPFDRQLPAPAGLKVERAEKGAILSWQPGAGKAMGTAIERRASGTRAFQRIATVGPDQSQFHDEQGSSEVSYRVQTLGKQLDSPYSGPVTVKPVATPATQTAPPSATKPAVDTPMPTAATPPTNPVPPAPDGKLAFQTVQRPGYSELVIQGTPSDDAIVVSQSDDAIAVSLNGKSPERFPGPFGEIIVRGNAGNDSITVDPSVKVRTRLYGGPGDNMITALGSGRNVIVTVGEGRDDCTGNGSDSSYWVDEEGVDAVHASRRELAAGRVHRIAHYYQPDTTDPKDPRFVGKAIRGQRWNSGSVRTRARYAENSFWGLGPSMFDVNQGLAQDCPLTGFAQTLALQAPGWLEETAVDLGDGTYAVQYGSAEANLYARVDGGVAAGWTSILGPSGNQWWLILEKVTYATYHLPMCQPAVATASLSQTLATDGDPEALFAEIKSALDKRLMLTCGNIGEAALDAPLVRQGHCYGLVGAFRDRRGQPHVIVRNPYGVYQTLWDTAPTYLSNGLSTLNMAQLQANFLEVSALDYAVDGAR